MTFFSHPAESENNKAAIPLIDHLVGVAKRAQSIVDDTGFKNKRLVCYAGLFHDLGKLNPYYQEQFDPNILLDKDDAVKSYDHFHSPYSRWIAERILKKTKSMSLDKMRKVWMLISCHHGVMKNTSGCFEGDDKQKSIRTKDILIKNWQEFVCSLENVAEFSDLDLNIELSPADNIKQSQPISVEQNHDPLEDFLELGFLFSALLWADKGFFHDSKPKEYDDIKKINTDANNKDTASLNSFRTNFQSHVRESVDPKQSITVINAPTGCGKTKAFLDMIPSYKPKRVFYFSPLLSLTNDFEAKLKKTDIDQKQILAYNHLYSGLLDDKNKVKNPDESNKPWMFDYEAFNEKFVITTMHRLLMTIYSNQNCDKLKLVSFKNALLIVDEVQTLPKFLLNNLCNIFKIMTQKMGTRVIMVSATIPYELTEIHTIKMHDDLKKQYLDQKNRQIIQKPFDVSLISSGKNLVMLNTRREALEKFYALKNTNYNVLYITSGITKNQQNKIIEKIKDNVVLISTQVIEAGIDISFSRIFRQMAPLDNIVQILGRLDREDSDKSSKLYIFDAKNNKPYSSLEYNLSKHYLKNISDTVSLYKALPLYYEEISKENRTRQQDSIQFDEYIGELDFENVWKMVSDSIGDNYYDSVYIPSLEDWDIVRSDLLSEKKSKIKKHAGLQALLPKPAFNFKEYFDEYLLEKKILFPKKEKLSDFYSDTVGLDKWIL